MPFDKIVSLLFMLMLSWMLNLVVLLLFNLMLNLPVLMIYSNWRVRN